MTPHPTPALSPTRRPTSTTPPVVLIVASILVAAAALLPLLYLIERAVHDGLHASAAALLRPRVGILFANTLTLVLAVCALATLIGILSAWALTCLHLPAPRLWVVLACLPLSIPSFVGAFAWLSVFPHITGLWPLTAVMSAASAPFVTVPTVAAFLQADHSSADVARTLGRSRAHVFFTITLPQIMPAAGAGTLIVALYTLADFGAPSMLRYDTLTTGVFSLLSAGASRSAPAAIGVVITVIAAGLVLCENLLRARHHATAHAHYQPAPARLTAWKTTGVTLALSTIGALSVGAPIIALLARALSNTRYDTDWERIAHAGLTTLTIGAAAATVAVVLGLPLSYISARLRSCMVTLLEIATFSGHALPGVVLALAMVSLTLALTPWAYQSLGALVIALVLLYLPKGVGAMRAGFQQVPVAAEESARTLGDGPLRVWWRVSLPQTLPAIGAGWLLIATAVMKELPVTLMLRPTGTNTLATELWNSSSLGAYGASAPVALALVVVGLVPALMLARKVEKA